MKQINKIFTEFNFLSGPFGDFYQVWEQSFSSMNVARQTHQLQNIINENNSLKLVCSNMAYRTVLTAPKGA